MKAHIIGVPGSGKTTLANWFGERFSVRVFDLDDGIVYDKKGRERALDEIDQRLDEIRRLPGWVTEGAYHASWLRPHLAGAEVIVWLDLPVHTSIIRIVRRHLCAEWARNNPHPGWRKLWRFLQHTRRTASAQRAETEALLAEHGAKIMRCRSSAGVDSLQRAFRGSQETV